MNEQVDFEGLLRMLLSSVPEFAPDPEDVADGNWSLIFNDLMRFLLEANKKKGEAAVSNVFRFLEACASSAEPRLRELVRDALYHAAVSSQRKALEQYMGENTRSLFRLVKRDHGV